MGPRASLRGFYSWPVTDVEAAVFDACVEPLTRKQIADAIVPRFPRAMVLEAVDAMIGQLLVRDRRVRALPRLRDHVLFPRARVQTGRRVWESIRAEDTRRVLLLLSGECQEDTSSVHSALRARYPRAQLRIETLPKRGWARAMRRLVREFEPDVAVFHQGKRYTRYHPSVAWSLGWLRVRHVVLSLGGQEIRVDKTFALLHPLRIFAKFLSLQHAVVWALAVECVLLRAIDVLTLGPLARSRSRSRAAHKRILLICVGGIGDIANTAGAVKLLKETWPDAEITMLSRKSTDAVARAIAGVDRTVDVTPLHDGSLTNPLTYWRWLVRLLAFQRRHYDDAVVLQWYGFGVRPLVWAYSLLYLTHATRRFAPHWRFPGPLKRIRFATHYIVRASELDQATQAWKIAAVVAGRPTADDDRSLPARYVPVLHPREEDRIHVREILQALGVDPRRELLLGIAPGTARNKIWSYERFAEVADRACEEFGARIVLLGHQDLLMRGIARRMRNPSVLVARLDTDLLPAFVECMALFVSNDSGPLHLAGCLGVPGVGIFGPTKPEVWAPNFASSLAILRGGSCPPCGNQMRCAQPRRICMESVTVEMVVDSLRRHLPVRFRSAPRTITAATP